MSSTRYVPIEEILASKGRLRILKLLLEYQELNITEIVRRTDLNHSIVLTHLKVLTEAGLVIEKRFGRIRIFRINLADPRVKLLKELFDLDKKLRSEVTGEESSVTTTSVGTGELP